MDQALVDELVGNAHGNLEAVREILTLHPEIIGARATWNETAIEAATQMGDRAIIDYLVEAGAPVDFFTALVLGDAGRVQADLKLNSELARSRGVHDLPALYFASIGGSVPVARMLVEKGADVNAKAEAAAPIHGAVMGGHERMVGYLLECGADVSVPDYKGRDARSLAMEMGQNEIVKLLAAPRA